MTQDKSQRARFEDALAKAGTEIGAYDALCALTKATVGAKLFTVMTAVMDAMEARRTYTDDPVNYPTSGTKPVVMNRWFETVLVQQRTFVANTLADIAEVFPDAELIGRLGCGSVINLPVILGGQVIATMNILHEEGYYSSARVAEVEQDLRLPALAAVLAAERLGSVRQSQSRLGEGV